MPDLRFESSDGEYLHLESEDGTAFRLLIDDGVRRAIRRDANTEQDSVKISPREIQLEIRAGVSIDDLVASTGASFEYIEKFAAPVIDELGHIVKSALSVRITMAGDRYSDTTQVEFGEVISNRLAAAGEITHSWSARRSDNGGWQLHCRYSDNVATWAFDPRKLALSPENENAIALSTQQSLTEGPIPKLRPVIDTVLSPAAALPVAAAVPNDPVSPEATQPPTALRSVASVQSATETFVEPPITSSSGNLTADLGRTVDFEGVVPFGRQSVPASQAAPASQSTEDLANTADLLDALRRRRIEREAEALTATVSDEASPLPIDAQETPAAERADQAYDSFEDDAIAVLETSSATSAAEAAIEDDLKPKKTGRASMPAWDSIVFGGKTEDES